MKKKSKPVEFQQINSFSIENDFIRRKSDSIYTDLVNRVKNKIKKHFFFDIFKKY